MKVCYLGNFKLFVPCNKNFIMKYLSSIILLSLVLFSCKQNAPAEDTTMVETTEEKIQKLTIVSDSTMVGWTAYKTSEKLPVKGVFKDFQLENINEEGETPTDILNGASIVISTASVFSQDSTRDFKLRTFFFEKLTGDIKGTLSFEEDNSYLTVNLNDVEKKFPVSYEISNNILTIESTIQLADFNALKALASLHEVCKDLHKGADGVSKTWEEVGINGRVFFEYQ